MARLLVYVGVEATADVAEVQLLARSEAALLRRCILISAFAETASAAAAAAAARSNAHRLSRRAIRSGSSSSASGGVLLLRSCSQVLAQLWAVLLQARHCQNLCCPVRPLLHARCELIGCHCTKPVTGSKQQQQHSSSPAAMAVN